MNALSTTTTDTNIALTLADRQSAHSLIYNHITDKFGFTSEDCLVLEDWNKIDSHTISVNFCYMDTIVNEHGNEESGLVGDCEIIDLHDLVKR